MRWALVILVAMLPMRAAWGEPSDASNGDQRGEPEAVSLLSEPLYPMKLTTDKESEYLTNLKEAEAQCQADPRNEEAIIWYGRRRAEAPVVRSGAPLGGPIRQSCPQ